MDNKEYLQIVLYAKGKYGKSKNHMEDLRCIVSIFTECNSEDITDRDILHWVKSAWSNFVVQTYKDMFFQELFYTHSSQFLKSKKEVSVSDVVGLMLSQLRYTQHNDCKLNSWDELPEKYNINFKVNPEP